MYIYSEFVKFRGLRDGLYRGKYKFYNIYELIYILKNFNYNFLMIG